MLLGVTVDVGVTVVELSGVAVGAEVPAGVNVGTTVDVGFGVVVAVLDGIGVGVNA